MTTTELNNMTAEQLVVIGLGVLAIVLGIWAYVAPTSAKHRQGSASAGGWFFGLLALGVAVAFFIAWVYAESKY